MLLQNSELWTVDVLQRTWLHAVLFIRYQVVELPGANLALGRLDSCLGR